MDGILLVDKPAGWTSHDVVAKVRRILANALGKKVKVGHTGTLDPAATGLLILVVGGYTKRAGEFSKLDKIYECEITLGAVSNTGDSEGKITPVRNYRPTLKEVTKLLKGFVGKTEQTPPAYSAVKVSGQRAYRLARAGKMPKLEPRQVEIYDLNDISYDYPIISFMAEVSSGTYIRSLAEDIGTKLQAGAYLSSLRRIKVGKFDIKNAKYIDKITISDIISA